MSAADYPASDKVGCHEVNTSEGGKVCCTCGSIHTDFFPLREDLIMADLFAPP